VTKAFALTSEQRDEFERRGVLRLRAFYPKADIDLMADRLWADLAARCGMRRDQPTTWTVASPAHFQALKRSGAFAALGSANVFALADALLGPGSWSAPTHWGGPLVTFPAAQSNLPRPPWHLDIGGVEPLDPLPTLRVFTFLEAVQPNGGGTLYVAGSHRLAIDLERTVGSPVRSAQVRDWLEAQQPWFTRLLAASMADLCALIGVEARVGSHTVGLEEMTGDPGDLIVMHPAILHGTAHNMLDRPRLMLTEWISRHEPEHRSS
jgi:hypothetical protein